MHYNLKQNFQILEFLFNLDTLSRLVETRLIYNDYSKYKYNKGIHTLKIKYKMKLYYCKRRVKVIYIFPFIFYKIIDKTTTFLSYLK